VFRGNANVDKARLGQFEKFKHPGVAGFILIPRKNTPSNTALIRHNKQEVISLHTGVKCLLNPSNQANLVGFAGMVPIADKVAVTIKEKGLLWSHNLSDRGVAKTASTGKRT
jgi:hypothetical protein